MKLFLAAVLLGINLLCLTLLGCSIWPGQLERLWILTIALWQLLTIVLPLMLSAYLPLIFIVSLWGLIMVSAVAALIIGTRARFKSSAAKAPPPKRRLTIRLPQRYRWRPLILVTVAMLFVAHVLLKLNLPMQAAFRLSQGAFVAQMSDAPVANERSDAAGLFQLLGFYRVDYYARDRRGGTYFETERDQFSDLSYGFAHQPNDVGSPFGDDSYITELIHGDWYWFRSVGGQ
ncbi:MAG: hypothetical protein ACFB0E_02695 [Leptolyngbyaceae cyanobacterium]